MSTYAEVFATIQDMEAVLPSISDYNRTRPIQGWATHSGSVYKAGSSGQIDQLLRDGFELGAVQSALADLTEDGEWYYDSSIDTVYLYSTNDPATSHTVEGAKDWTDTVNEALKFATEMVRSKVGKPIVKRKGSTQGATERSYDAYVILSCAGLAVSHLVKPFNVELAESIEKRYDNEEDFNEGILQQIRSGKIRLHNEMSRDRAKGNVFVVSENASSTGGIIDVAGNASETQIIKIEIANGGTFSYGTANSTITFNSYVRSADGIMTNKYSDSVAINGSFQSVGGGMECVFSDGVYTTGDTYWLDVVADDFPDTQNPIKSATMERF